MKNCNTYNTISSNIINSLDIIQPEKIAFIDYNLGIDELVQKFGSLITSGKITDGPGVSKIEVTFRTQSFL